MKRLMWWRNRKRKDPWVALDAAHEEFFEARDLLEDIADGLIEGDVARLYAAREVLRSIHPDTERAAKLRAIIQQFAPPQGPDIDYMGTEGLRLTGLPEWEASAKWCRNRADYWRAQGDDKRADAFEASYRRWMAEEDA